MGIEINQRTFSASDQARFAERLEQQLEALAGLIAQPGFGRGASSLGSELELYIVDAQGRPAWLNQELLERAADPQLTLELDRYNLEYNLTPQRFEQGGLRATEQEMLDKVASLNQLAAGLDAAVVPIGILPTLTPDDFGAHSLTDRVRYHALVTQLMRRRGDAFQIEVDGPEPLSLRMRDITLEGANTSFQVHWRVAPDEYARAFNALQLVTPVVLALAANSPGIFGHDLWDETRIPLFKQSIDTRHPDPRSWHEPARVNFGQGWVRQGAFELFAESVRLFSPLLPCCGDVPQPHAGFAPELGELRLHQSTVWQWNRPVYDPVDGGHLRIELRSLPAGPTPIDMVAGAAFALGAARALMEDIDALMPGLPFGLAEQNFYRAAQHGLDADLIWPRSGQQGLEVCPVTAVAAALLPRAADGLQALAVSSEERGRYLGVIDERLQSGITGARWQRLQSAARGDAGESRSQALAGMLDNYRALSASNTPVHQWPVGL